MNILERGDVNIIHVKTIAQDIDCQLKITGSQE